MFAVSGLEEEGTASLPFMLMASVSTIPQNFRASSVRRKDLSVETRIRYGVVLDRNGKRGLVFKSADYGINLRLGISRPFIAQFQHQRMSCQPRWKDLQSNSILAICSLRYTPDSSAAKISSVCHPSVIASFVGTVLTFDQDLFDTRSSCYQLFTNVKRLL